MHHHLETDHQQRVRALAEQLIDSADQPTVDLLLDALMAAYVAVAEAHHGCTSAAALVCVSMASRLQKASLSSPQGIALH